MLDNVQGHRGGHTPNIFCVDAVKLTENNRERLHNKNMLKLEKSFLHSFLSYFHCVFWGLYKIGRF